MKDLPTEEIKKMKKEGKDNSKIASDLLDKGYDPTQISEAMNQTKIRGDYQPSILDEDEIPLPPEPEEIEEFGETEEEPKFQPTPQYTPPQLPQTENQVEEIIEAIVEEKWQGVSQQMDNLIIWRDRVSDDLSATKQEILRISQRFDMLQNSLVGKVDEYNQSINDITSEVKALEKVFQNIMQPLTSNIKELNRITQNLRRTT